MRLFFIVLITIGIAVPVMAKPSSATRISTVEKTPASVTVPYPDMEPIARVFFLPTIRLVLRNVAWDPKNVLPLDITHCMAKLNADVTSGMFVPRLTNLITAPEALAALQFLASPTGQKYVDRQRPIAKTGAIFSPHPVFSAEELDEIRMFANSATGRKLMGDFRTLQGMRDATMSVIDQSLQRCGAQAFFATPEGEAFQQRLSLMRKEPAPSAKPADSQLERSNSAQISNATDVETGELACTSPRPVYPDRALPLGGKTIVRMFIGEDGAVTKTAIIESSGVTVLDIEAEVAVKNMRCKPYLVEGTPTKATAAQPISFVPN